MPFPASEIKLINTVEKCLIKYLNIRYDDVSYINSERIIWKYFHKFFFGYLREPSRVSINHCQWNVSSQFIDPIVHCILSPTKEVHHSTKRSFTSINYNYRTISLANISLHLTSILCIAVINVFRYAGRSGLIQDIESLD